MASGWDFLFFLVTITASSKITITADTPITAELQMMDLKSAVKRGLELAVMGLCGVVMDLAAIERAHKRQASRITNLNLGDTNTKIFHRKINGRRRKNHIQRLQKQNGWAFNHEEKVEVVQNHFKKVLGQPGQRGQDWDTLQLPVVDLQGLDEPFTEDELRKAVLEMLMDKAPGPNGRGFLQKLLGDYQVRHCRRGQCLL